MSILNLKAINDIKTVVDLIKTTVTSLSTSISAITTTVNQILAKNDANITTRLSSNDVRLDFLDAPVSGIATSFVKSIQTVLVTNIQISSKTVNISSVNQNNSIIIIQPYYSTSANIVPAAAATFLSGSQISVVGTQNTQAYVTILEFN